MSVFISSLAVFFDIHLADIFLKLGYDFVCVDN